MTINHFPDKISNPMDESFEKKCAAVKKLFDSSSSEERYQILIKIGRELSPLSPSEKIPENIVQGCQSILYLAAEERDGKMFFKAESDALISSGLAALLIALYSGESRETILTQPPLILAELGIQASLSLNRSNGLVNIHLRMKQEALKSLTKSLVKRA
jgi:cysteine desulfuration protein SufE